MGAYQDLVARKVRAASREGRSTKAAMREAGAEWRKTHKKTNPRRVRRTRRKNPRRR